MKRLILKWLGLERLWRNIHEMQKWTINLEKIVNRLEQEVKENSIGLSLYNNGLDAMQDDYKKMQKLIKDYKKLTLKLKK